MAGSYTAWTEEIRARFLESLAEGRTVTSALDELNLSRSRAYELRRGDEDFAAAWDEAAQIGADLLEDEARRRAVVGVDEPVFYQGERCGHVRKYSDTLLIFLLKGARPDKYRERAKIEHVGANDGPIQVQAVDYRQAIAPLAPDDEAG